MSVRSSSWRSSGAKRGSRERGRDGVGLDVAAERPPRLQRADAAPQVALLLQRDERRAVHVEPRLARRERVAGAQRVADRAARHAQQRAAVGLGVVVAVVIFAAAGRGALAEREARVADDAPLVARGVARVAQVEEFGHEPAAARDFDEAHDRRRAAGLLVVQRGVEAQGSPARWRRRSPARPRSGGSATGPTKSRSASRGRPTGARARRRPAPRWRRRRPAARSATSPSARCRNGSWTSSACSSACAASLTLTPGMPAMAFTAAWSTRSVPSGVSNAVAAGKREPAHRHAVAGAEDHDAGHLPRAGASRA